MKVAEIKEYVNSLPEDMLHKDVQIWPEGRQEPYINIRPILEPGVFSETIGLRIIPYDDNDDNEGNDKE